MEIFYKDVVIVCEVLFLYELFQLMKNCFNIVVVVSFLVDSGVSVFKQGVWKYMVFGFYFDIFYFDCYLIISWVKVINDVLVGIFYEYIIILVNME